MTGQQIEQTEQQSTILKYKSLFFFTSIDSKAKKKISFEMKYNIDYFVHPETDARNCNYHSIKKDEKKLLNIL